MTARVLPFTGQWQGRAEPTPYEGKTQARGLHDARLIRAATSANDDWTARVLLMLLRTLTRKQLNSLEFQLLGQMDSQSALEALAVVQRANGTNVHREAVRSALERLAAREGE